MVISPDEGSLPEGAGRTRAQSSTQEANPLRTLTLPGTEEVLPVIGQGTWRFGADRNKRTAEVDALRLGIELGMTLIDTAEVYSGGESETIVGDAIRGVRDKVFLVTKVWPVHASEKGVVASVRDSLARLGTDHADGVLLHQPTRRVPIKETLGALRKLQKDGIIRYFGVSNFDGPRLDEAQAGLGEGARLTFNQVPYSIGNRRVEMEVLPRAQERGQVIHAYSPLGHSRASKWDADPALRAVADSVGATPAQVAIAWTVRRNGIISIPKATKPDHVRQNAGAGDLILPPGAQEQLDRAFPFQGKPFRPMPVPEVGYDMGWWMRKRI